LKSRTQFFVLRGDSHRASIEMALTGHDASNRQQGRSTKTEFIRAENSGQHDIARKFQASVHAERES